MGRDPSRARILLALAAGAAALTVAATSVRRSPWLRWPLLTVGIVLVVYSVAKLSRVLKDSGDDSGSR